MKFCFVLLDETYYRGKTYVIDLLGSYMVSQGHEFGWFPFSEIKKPMNQKIFQEAEVVLLNNSSIRETGWLAKKKKVIVFKMAYSLEMYPIVGNCNYGIPSSYFLQTGHHDNKFLPSGVRRFDCPVYGAYQIPKAVEDRMSKSSFGAKYGLDMNKKWVILLPGLLGKILKFSIKQRSSSASRVLASRIDWFAKNFGLIQFVCRDLGFELIVKHHSRHHEFFTEDKYHMIDKYLECPQIDYQDTWEALNYSTFAMTLGSSIAYELYVYGLPTLELGTGRYMYRWSRSSLSKKTMEYWKLYACRLIFGHVCSDSEIADFKKTVQWFSDNLPEISEFEFRDNHPLHGTSYHNSVEKMYELIMSQV